MERIIKAKAAAEMMGVCPRTISRLAKLGSIELVVLPGMKYAVGYWESEIKALLVKKQDSRKNLTTQTDKATV